VKVVVEIVAGARAGQRFELDADKPIRLGRHPDNDVAFDPEADRDVSGHHCELRGEGGQLWLVDVGSANGTRLNNVQVTRAALPSPSLIELGPSGPRVRVSHDGNAAVIPATIARVTPPGNAATGRVGQRTVALMIQQALARAQKEPERLRRLVVVLAALLVLTLGGVVVAYRLRPAGEASLRREMVTVMERQRAAGDVERATLQKRLDALTAELARAGGTSGAVVARANHDAIYLVAVHSPTGAEQGFCSAFAVSDDTLITNAHCVYAAEDLRKRGGQILILQNGNTKTRLNIARMKRIRAFVPNGPTITPDVGWLKIDDGKLGQKVTLATATEYEALATGDPMFTYGFPGRLADVSAPEATFVSGVIGRVTTLDGRSGEAKERRLIQHSAFTSAGTSGSPIFNGAGHVVAVNTGGYLDEGKLNKNALAGYNFGMRIDLAQELLNEGDE
jgi:V8-like Glu-specific endopeptidase